MSRINDIIQCITEWQRKLKDCQYVGEIYLDFDEIQSLADDFVRVNGSQKLNREQYETALLVLAVNCAYHYYDDEGFWIHFCKLIRIDNSTPTLDSVGHAIERRLKSLGLLSFSRSGPFRYVGAILEQCGVSRKHIVPFARVVREIKSFRDWNSLLSVSHVEFRNRVSNISCSKFLKNFLMDKEGWQFTLEVSRMMLLYEQGVLNIEDLKTLPGFQPSFWEEFLGCFAPNRKIVKKKVHISLKPRLFLFPEEKSVGLRFPTPQFTEGMKHPIVKKVKWRYPVTVFDHPEFWSDRYSGTVPDSDGTTNEWRIPGWIPDGGPVLFDIKYGLISPGTIVSPGEYFLLAPPDFNLCGKTITDLGKAILPTEIDYRVYRVQLTDSDTIDGYGTKREMDRDVSFAWINPGTHRFEHSSAGFDVFLGKLPELSISDFSDIENGTVGLFFHTNRGSGRIRSASEWQRFRKEAETNLPVFGRLVLSDMRRGRWNDITSTLRELEFCVIPPVTISFEQKLYSYRDEPVIRVIESGGSEIFFDRCKRIDKAGKDWIVPGGVSEVSGVLKCQEISVDISIPVYRTAVYRSDGQPVRFIDLSELRLTKEDFKVLGLPGATGELCLFNNLKNRIPVSFDSGGICTINSMELAGIFTEAEQPLDEIMADCSGEQIPTGMVVFNLNILRTRVYAGNTDFTGPPSAKNLIKALKLCGNLCISKTQPLAFSNTIPPIHAGFNDFVNEILACATVFDETEISVGGRPYDWISTVKNNNLRRLLVSFRSGNLEGLSKETYTILDDLPDVQRWKTAMENSMKQFTTEGLLDWLREWAGEIKKHRVPYKSMIAREPSGEILSKAWEFYLKGRTGEAIAQVNNIETGSHIISGLKGFLHALLLMRSGRILTARRAVEDSVIKTPLTPAMDLLANLINILSGAGGLSAIEKNGLNIIKEFPLRHEDIELFRFAEELNESPGYIFKQFGDNGDWIITLIGINCLKDSEYRGKLVSILERAEKSMPVSPEKPAVTSLFQQMLGGK